MKKNRFSILIIWATFTLFSRRVTSQSVDPALPCRHICCLGCFCCGPGTSWSLDSELCLQDPKSLSGDDDESCGEADPSVCYDFPSCTEGDCCGAGTVMDLDPDDSIGGRCLCFGEIPFVDPPTSSPTITSSPSPPTSGAKPVTEPSSAPPSSVVCGVTLKGDDKKGQVCLQVNKPTKCFTTSLKKGTPKGGTYQFTTAPGTEGNRRVRLFKRTIDSVIVEGLKVSDRVNDTSLYVRYTTPGGKKCTDLITLKVALTCTATRW